MSDIKKDLANLICLTIDVEWASPEVLQDIITLLDERELRATFFCTHADIDVDGHEQAIHPNFRRNGDTMRKLSQEMGDTLNHYTDKMVYEYVVRHTKTFCPAAVGVRSHSLFYDSELLPIYRQAGIEYDSSHSLPLASGLSPTWKEHDILEMPIYYVDHIDLINQMSGFRLEGLRMEQPGMKVFDFHPNMVFLNAATEADYLESKSHYHDFEKLLSLRRSGPGIRNLFLDLLDFIKSEKLITTTLADVNTAYRGI
ncbi:MAG: hypothetical protein AABY43_04015 [Candidatus Omnitrophota bacterium]